MNDYRTVRYGPVRPGDQPSASRWNALEEAARSREIAVGYPLEVAETGAGYAVTADLPERIWVRITQVGAGADVGKYGWQRLVGGSSGGSWIDVPGHFGTLAGDPLYEASLEASLNIGDRVEAEREPHSGEMRTQVGLCP